MRTTTGLLLVSLALFGAGLAALWTRGSGPVREGESVVAARPTQRGEPVAVLERPLGEDGRATEARAPAASSRSESDGLDVPAAQPKRATRARAEVRRPEEYQDDPELNPDGLVLTTEQRGELQALLVPNVQKSRRLSDAMSTRLRSVAEARIAQGSVPRQPPDARVDAAPAGVRRLRVVKPDGLYVVDVVGGEDPELDTTQLELDELVRHSEALVAEYFARLPR